VKNIEIRFRNRLFTPEDRQSVLNMVDDLVKHPFFVGEGVGA
jgi:hypothetical protein